MQLVSSIAEVLFAAQVVRSTYLVIQCKTYSSTVKVHTSNRHPPVLVAIKCYAYQKQSFTENDSTQSMANISEVKYAVA
jgi:hypothetical protein